MSADLDGGVSADLDGGVSADLDGQDPWRETEHLLRSPANARRLPDAGLARDKAGEPGVMTTLGELREPSADD